MPGKSFRLTPLALSDLTDIHKYSTQHWGIGRAESYITDINTAFQDLADNHWFGRNYGHIKPGLFAYSVASHVLFYSVTDYGVLIIRVLHKSMDYSFHLG